MSTPFTTETRKTNAGSFRKGADPRRHRCTPDCTHPRYTFTPEDCAAGGRASFFDALATYAELGGNPRNFLRNKMRARGQQYRPRQGRRRA